MLPLYSIKVLHHNIEELFQNFYSCIHHSPNFFIFPILQVEVIVLELVIDVIIMNFILNVYVNVIVILHDVYLCALLPFFKNAIEDDLFSLHQSFLLSQQILKRKSIMLQGFPILQTKQLRFLDQFA